MQWSEGLPDYQSPSWLGLPNNAEKVILTSLGMDSILKHYSLTVFGLNLEHSNVVVKEYYNKSVYKRRRIFLKLFLTHAVTHCYLSALSPGDKMLVNVLKMQVMSEEDELAYSPEIRFDFVSDIFKQISLTVNYIKSLHRS